MLNKKFYKVEVQYSPLKEPKIPSTAESHRNLDTGEDGEKFSNGLKMSLVDYASSSDDDVPEPTEEERKKEEKPQPPPPPPRSQ